MATQWIRESCVDKMIHLIKLCPEMKPFQNYPEMYPIIADLMYSYTVKPVEYNLNNEFVSGFCLITKGSIKRKRVVDFGKLDYDRRSLFVGSIPIEVPHGKKLIQTDQLGPGHVVAEPSLSCNLVHPYSLVVNEPVEGFVWRYDILRDTIPRELFKEILALTLNDPTDEALIRIWVEREKDRKWRMFRSKVLKESRKYIRAEQEFYGKKPQPPKSLKQYSPRVQKFKQNFAIQPPLESLYPRFSD